MISMLKWQHSFIINKGDWVTCQSTWMHFQVTWFFQLRCSPHFKTGLIGDLNPGPLAPEARIIPLDQRASTSVLDMPFSFHKIFHSDSSAWIWRAVFLKTHLQWKFWQCWTGTRKVYIFKKCSLSTQTSILHNYNKTLKTSTTQMVCVYIGDFEMVWPFWNGPICVQSRGGLGHSFLLTSNCDVIWQWPLLLISCSEQVVVVVDVPRYDLIVLTI